MRRATETSTSHLDPNADDTTADLSILRRPIKTSTSGLNEARKAYENGTDEVRQLLANECDLIYECKVCRNVFRSLVNFISHKRIYCKSTFNSSAHFNFHNDGRSGYNQDLTTIVQAEKDFISASKSSRSQEKDLSSIVERLVKRERANQMLKLSDFYEQVSSKLTQDQILQKKHVLLQLDTVPDSSVAVYQTIKTDSCDSIKTEISEINDLMDNDNTVLGPDGRIIAAYISDEGESENVFECEICKNQFATQKTLKLHIETKHIPSTYVYQCPSCSKTFLQVKAVIRHLTNDHKKSMKRVRLMRDSILKRRTRIDEVQVKGPSRELARLQTCQEKADAQNKAWLENLENIDASVSVNVCTFCGKRFDRRVVLLSHSKVCQQKYKTAENVSLTKKAIEEENGSMDSIESVSCWPSTVLDESSNSNSIDTETYAYQNATANKRKQNRTVRVNIKDKRVETDEDDAEKEFNQVVDDIDRSAGMEVDVFEGGNIANTTTWNIIDPETKMNICTIKEIKREEETTSTKATNGEKIKEKETSSSNCKYCNKNFSNPSNLRRHITMLHVRQRKFGCLLCKEFRAFRKIDVVQHIHTVHEFAGKKASIAEYISEKEDTISNFQPTQNRRKDKHTAVLKDDEVQVILEPDDNETSNSAPFPDTMSDGSKSMENSTNSSDKLIKENTSSSQFNGIRRKGRPKIIVKRQLSQENERSVSADSNIARRPVRNRTMPVKKDFVYDLSNLLKKDAALYSFKDHHTPPEESQEKQNSTVTLSPNVSPSPTTDKPKKKKRRNTIQGNTNVIEPEKQNGVQEAASFSAEIKKSDRSEITRVKGAADEMAMLAVNSNRAIFSRPPKLPTERPITRTLKHRNIRSLDSIALRNWPILKRPMRGGLKSKSNNLNATVHNFRHVLKRRKNFSPLSRQLTTINHNMSGGEEKTKLNGSETTINAEMSKKIIKISSKIADKIQMKYAENVGEKLRQIGTENESIKGHVTRSEDNEAPKRRMTLLERLAENKTKKMKESLSTMQNKLKQEQDSDEISD